MFTVYGFLSENNVWKKLHLKNCYFEPFCSLINCVSEKRNYVEILKFPIFLRFFCYVITQKCIHYLIFVCMYLSFFAKKFNILNKIISRFTVQKRHILHTLREICCCSTLGQSYTNCIQLAQKFLCTEMFFSCVLHIMK